MYSNIGKKIQSIAQITGWCSLILGALVWIILIFNGESVPTYYGYTEYVYDTSDDLIAWVSLLTGVSYYIASWFIYGFGQLVDDVRAMREKDSTPATPEAPSSDFYNNLPEL